MRTGETPRWVAYQEARDWGSLERKKSPPMPRTFSMVPPRGREDISQRTRRRHPDRVGINAGRGKEGQTQRRRVRREEAKQKRGRENTPSPNSLRVKRGAEQARPLQLCGNYGLGLAASCF